MSRPGPAIQAPEGTHSTPARHTGTGIRAVAGITVAVVAGIAGAISYSHMRALAAAGHGETGWQAHTIPSAWMASRSSRPSCCWPAGARGAPRAGCRGPRWRPGRPRALRPTLRRQARIWWAGWWRAGPRSLLVAVKLLSQLLEPRKDDRCPPWAVIVPSPPVTVHRPPMLAGTAWARPPVPWPSPRSWPSTATGPLPR
jgi:hypothetical protein